MKEEAHRRHLSGDAGKSHGSKLLGILLVVGGFFWFAKKSSWIPIASGGAEIFWPVVAIIIGSFIIFGLRGRRDGREQKNN